MRCKWVTDRVSAFVDGELSSKEAARVKEHLADCASCRKQVEAVRRTARLLRSQPHVQPSATFDTELAVSLRKIKRDEAAASEWWRRIWRPIPVPQPVVAAAAFAVVVVVGGLLLGPQLGREPTEMRSVTDGALPGGSPMTAAGPTMTVAESLLIGSGGESLGDVEYVLDEIVLPQPQVTDETRAVSSEKSDRKVYVTF